MRAKRSILAAGIAAACLVLTVQAYGAWSLEREDRRDDARQAAELADWPAKRVEIEAALLRVVVPGTWTPAGCDAIPNTGSAPPSTEDRCWVSPSDNLASYRDAAVTALVGAGVQDVSWQCHGPDSPSIPDSVPPPCWARGTVAGRGVLLIANGRLTGVRRGRTWVYEGAHLSLSADLCPESLMCQRVATTAARTKTVPTPIQPTVYPSVRSTDQP